MQEPIRRERDLVLAPNEFAFLSDDTKGNINVYCGPHKSSLANTDQPVVFNHETKRFDRVSLEQATQKLVIAPEGWYITLKNPGQDGKHPTPGTVNSLIALDVGRKVHLPGPLSFALWPGQMARVLQGHHLRSNQYLVVRVYDERMAKENWGRAVIKPVEGEATAALPVAPDFTMGKLLIIKGTHVSFYIPPTGIEVVCDERGEHVREAVTLERLEYCILLDENGNKRYLRGPDVVFPNPTETFVLARNGLRKFKAIELNEISGIYVKVIAPYAEDDGTERKVGEELFITGAEQMIYYPRPEHAIIKYGDRDIHYAVAIPGGEARYVMNRISGEITVVRGPRMFLPDPRREVIVRRVLDPKLVELWFPGNAEALEYNLRLLKMQKAEADQPLTEDRVRGRAAAPRRTREEIVDAVQAAAPRPEATFAGDDFERQQVYSPPRMITLDTKYDGAVSINVWTGYAIQVVSRSGARRVIVGPQTVLLEYDETLEAFELSTGTPKSDERKVRSVYLRARNNKVSDIVVAETKDLCAVSVKLSYRVHFEGDASQWFAVENYVKFLCDHVRSVIRNAVKAHTIESFYGDSIAILRDAVLGKPDEKRERRGMAFPENGMRVYDVEVLHIDIDDDTISALLYNAHQEALKQDIVVAQKEKELEVVRKTEEIKRLAAVARAETVEQELKLARKAIEQKLAVRLAEAGAEIRVDAEQLAGKIARQEGLGQIHDAELSRENARVSMELEHARRRLEQRIEDLRAEVQAVVDKAKAIDPGLVAALQAFADKELAGKLAESMAPLSIIGGESVVDVFGKLVQGTGLEALLKRKALPEKGAK